MPQSFSTFDPDFESRFQRVLESRRSPADDVGRTVAGILARVHDEGDDALLDLTRQFDAPIDTAADLRIPDERLESALAGISPETRAALETAAERIEAFHARETFEGFRYTDAAGVGLGARYTPIDSVGVYVPGGRAAYPSTVLMNVLPARVAGVQRVVMTVPEAVHQGAAGEGIGDVVLAAARLAGVDEVYRIGGAQAIAALAFGTDTISPVDKIVGPGNAYVAEAKRQVFGRVGIDGIAGPSEVLVIADGDSDPSWIAADLLAQAEHDPMARSIVITDDPAFAEAVQRAVEAHLEVLPRAEIARASWHDHGAVITVATMDEAVDLADRIAPEHLELAVANAEGLAARVRHAGAIFLGRYTPEAVSDYVAGPNHVLPTDRTARFASGLSVADFVKRTTIVRCDPLSLGNIGPAAMTLAEEEGLSAHALSIRVRLMSAPEG
ncbi:histidinol dehydrogenase [Fodinicurvata sp. EGI_FJ10296]|uniref:histidinol dehydrogenase n=1 Tax=Fodinicurvata sp. EGI_FJ10296 TaxID=3231908 RepID=UPI003451D92F